MFEAIILIVSAALNLLVGLLVYVKDQRAIMNRLFLALTATLALWSTANYLSVHPLFFSQLFLVRLVLFFGALLNLMVFLTFLTFPSATMPQQYRQRAKWAILASAVVMLLALTPLLFKSLAVKNGHASPVVAPGIALLMLQTILLLGGSVLGVIKKYNRSKGRTKEQFRLILLGIGGTFGLIFVSNFLLVVVLKISTLVPLGPAFTLVFSVSFAYAIIRHQLFNIRRAAARGFVYLLTIGFMAATYSLLILGASTLLLKGDHRLDARTQTIITVLALLMALSFQSIKQFFDKLSAKTFFKDSYNSQEVLNELNQIIVATVGLDEMLQKTLNLIEQSLKADFCLAVLTIPGFKESRVIGTSKKLFSAEDLAVAHSKRLIGQPAELVIVTDYLDEDRSRLREVLQRNDIALLARIGDIDAEDKDKQLGHIIVGPKKNGNAYDTQDIKLVEIFTNELVIAIQNALRFEQIQNFNVTLQEKVQLATRELRRTNDKLKALDETKDDFISMASHQLRTPLTSVKGYLSMVLEGDAGKINKVQREMLGQAFTSSQRMVYLIADLLNVSRLRTGKFVIEPTPVDLSELVAQEMSQLMETAAAKSLTLTFDKPAHFPEIMLDETKTRQVIMNFMDNAIYYTPSGGHITIELENKPSSVELRVVDDGIGVPKSEQHHLFTKFYRAGNARKARPDGTGLGLFMAKKVVVAEGGAIIFTSQEGKGSTFGFSFSKEGRDIASMPVKA